MKKVITIIGIVLLIVAVVGFVLITSTNAKKAEEIHERFLGQSFRGTAEDDEGFARDARNGNLNGYTTYWKKTTKCALSFNEDGTVDYTYKYHQTPLAYPALLGKPEDSGYEHDGTYPSFEVKVELDGDIILLIGGEECVVMWDHLENRPDRIWGYKGVDLY